MSRLYPHEVRPIMTDDKLQIGGIGLSGGTADQDETYAQAGIDAVKDALK
jgi:uncharacterized protein GlcG (DUF336 family)